MTKPPYCALLAYADLGGARIERIFLKGSLEEAIRFNRMGRVAVRPLEVTEDELLILLGDALAGAIFSRRFLIELHVILNTQL